MSQTASTPTKPGQTHSNLEHSALWFTGVLVTACLVLQRFSLPFGDKHFSLVGPLGLTLAGYGLAKGFLDFHRGRLIAFLALSAFATFGAAWHATESSSFGDGQASINSLLQFLLLTSFATLTFKQPVSEVAFFNVFTFTFMLIGVAGILQFAAQLFGFTLFAFTGLLPDSILFEATYHLEIPVGISSLLKANGFFLVEPSVFSQLMAMGVIIEVLQARRLLYLAIFTLGLLLSFSGTGWIVLGAFVLGSTIGTGSRGVLISLTVVALLGTALAVVALFAPDFLTVMGARLGEINQPGTSGHGRFITPFWLLSDVFSADAMSALFGIGAGASEGLTLPYLYSVNTPVKVVVEYGIPALVTYVALFILGRKTPVQSALLLPAIILFFFTGGYQQFPPIIFIVLLLTSVGNLR